MKGCVVRLWKGTAALKHSLTVPQIAKHGVTMVYTQKS